jgi:TPR repeat protein
MAMAETTPEERQTRAEAQKGDAEAQMMLGIYLYNKGMRGSQPDATEAIEWLNKAARQNNAAAEFYLGAAFNTGTGTAQSKTEAIKWWHKAAEDGNLDAQATLGNVYFNDPKDGFQSYLWRLYAAQHGHNAAVQDLRLVEAYMTPQEIKQAHELVANWDPSKQLPQRPPFPFPTSDIIMNPPIEHLRAAADQGNNLSQLELSHQYSLGKLPRNDEEAKKWMRKAADNGNAQAMRSLASLYASETAQWNAKAEIQEKLDAQAYLDMLRYYEIKDTPKESSSAIKYWTKLAADQRNKQALYNLAVAYHRGFGVTQNDVQSNMYFTIAVMYFDWKSSLEPRTAMRKLLTETQIKQCNDLAKSWDHDHPPVVPSK